MARETGDWKKAQQQGNRGVHAYIGKTDLKSLVEDDVISLDEPIEYKVSVGSSDGRARAFIELRNAEEGEGE